MLRNDISSLKPDRYFALTFQLGYLGDKLDLKIEDGSFKPYYQGGKYICWEIPVIGAKPCSPKDLDESFDQLRVQFSRADLPVGRLNDSDPITFCESGRKVVYVDLDTGRPILQFFLSEDVIIKGTLEGLSDLDIERINYETFEKEEWEDVDGGDFLKRVTTKSESVNFRLMALGLCRSPELVRTVLNPTLDNQGFRSQNQVTIQPSDLLRVSIAKTNGGFFNEALNDNHILKLIQRSYIDTCDVLQRVQILHSGGSIHFNLQKGEFITDDDHGDSWVIGFANLHVDEDARANTHILINELKSIKIFICGIPIVFCQVKLYINRGIHASVEISHPDTQFQIHIYGMLVDDDHLGPNICVLAIEFSPEFVSLPTTTKEPMICEGVKNYPNERTEKYS